MFSYSLPIYGLLFLHQLMPTQHAQYWPRSQALGMRLAQYMLLFLVLKVTRCYSIYSSHPFSYTTHFISKYYYHSVGLGLRLEQSGWTMSTAMVQNQG